MFGVCKRITGEAIAKENLHLIDTASLDISNCRGQGYDGAVNMSSEAVGTQAFIKRLCPKAVYTHCCRHNLALVVVTACKMPVIKTCLPS